MHTRLIILSLHGVVVFFVIIECADKYMCRCNKGGNSKPPMHASQYVTMVARLARFCSLTFNMANTWPSLQGEWPIQSKYTSLDAMQ